MKEVDFHESEARLANAFDDAWVNGYRSVNDCSVNDRSVNDRSVNDRSVNDRSVNDRSVNDRSVDDRSVDERSVDDRSVNDRSLNDRSMNDHPTSTTALHQRSPYINDCSTVPIPYPKPPYKGWLAYTNDIINT